MRKDKFPLRRKSRLMVRRYGPYKIMQRVGDNPYKVKLPGDMNISATFNVGTSLPISRIKMRTLKI